MKLTCNSTKAELPHDVPKKFNSSCNEYLGNKN